MKTKLMAVLFLALPAMTANADDRLEWLVNKWELCSLPVKKAAQELLNAELNKLGAEHGLKFTGHIGDTVVDEVYPISLVFYASVSYRVNYVEKNGSPAEIKGIVSLEATVTANEEKVANGCKVVRRTQ